MVFAASSLDDSGQAVSIASNILSVDTWVKHSGLILTVSVITGGVISLSSLAKIVSLRSGGGKVARDMGGTMVTHDTRDPLRRRLRYLFKKYLTSLFLKIQREVALQMSINSSISWMTQGM